MSSFNGQSFESWHYFDDKGGECFVTNGMIVCPESSRGDRLTGAEYSGSLNGTAPPKNVMPKVGPWNTQETTCIGRYYKIILNGQMIVDTDMTGFGSKIFTCEYRCRRHSG